MFPSSMPASLLGMWEHGLEKDVNITWRYTMYNLGRLEQSCCYLSHVCRSLGKTEAYT